MRSITCETEHGSICVTFKGDLVSATYSDVNGITATGHALYHPDDVYSDTFGLNLAVARASSRYFRKIEKQLIRGTR
jgi:hypothetical protein